MLAIVLIVILILLNGFFAAAEMAFVTARPARLQGLADAGNRRALRVLALKENSADFLATVQIGITLVATLASAVGGADVARQFAPLLEPLFGSFADRVALAIVVLVITYTSLVIGELVPKQLAIRNAEQFAMRVVHPLQWLQKIVWLPIRILNFSADALLSLFGATEEPQEIESTEELTLMVQKAAEEGVVDSAEEQLITSVFDYSETQLHHIMTPLANTLVLAESATIGEVLDEIRASGFSRIPIYADAPTLVASFIHVKDLLGEDPATPLTTYARNVCKFSEALYLPVAYKQLIKAEQHLAIVENSAHEMIGIVTMEDILEELVGEIEDEHDVYTYTPPTDSQND